MSFTEICIWSIWLYGLDWKGQLHPWSFSSWSFRWAKELKHSGELGLKTDWNCLFRAVGFSQSLERVLPPDFNGATTLESCFECLSSKYIFLVFTLGGLFSSCSVVVFIPRISPRYKNVTLILRPYLWPCKQGAYMLGISLCQKACKTFGFFPGFSPTLNLV